MAGMAASSQQADFAARIARIQSGASSSKHTIFVGMDDSFEMPERRRGSRNAPAAGLANALYPLSVLAVLGLGVMSHGLAMVARFWLSGLPKVRQNPDVEMLTQFVLGFLVALLIARALKIKARELALARSIGVVLAVLLFHNAVHLWPDLFARLFSPIWVADVLSFTEPRSVFLRGISLTF
jgi:hypothetical protein